MTLTYDLEEVLERIEPALYGFEGTPCWPWPNRLDNNGYGHARSNGVQTTAHRVVYVHLIGPFDEVLDMDHLCRNRDCVNPLHLEPVTHKVNMERGMKAQATHCLRGHELTNDNVRIRANGTRNCKQCKRDKRSNGEWK